MQTKPLNKIMAYKKSKKKRITCRFCGDQMLDIPDARRKIGGHWIDIGCWLMYLAGKN